MRARINAWRVKVTKRETWFVNIWMYARDLSPGKCVTRELFVSFCKNLKFFGDFPSFQASALSGYNRHSRFWNVIFGHFRHGQALWSTLGTRPRRRSERSTSRQRDLWDLRISRAWCSVSVSMEKEVEILPSATNTVTVKVLVSYFLYESGGSASTQAIHNENFNVPIDASHKELYNFRKHMVA